MDTFRTPLSPPGSTDAPREVFFLKARKRLATIEEKKRLHYHFLGNLYFSGEIITFGEK